MPKANKCLKELESRRKYNLISPNQYKMVSEEPIPVAKVSPVVFKSKFNIT